MALVAISRGGSVLLSPEYFAFAEAAAGTIGDQQVAMGLPPRKTPSARVKKITDCPFCDSPGYTVQVTWKEGTATAQATCAVCGTRCESRWLREPACSQNDPSPHAPPLMLGMLNPSLTGR